MRYHDYDKDRIMFQFHKGSINTMTASALSITLSRFNSIKVRLILVVMAVIPVILLVSIP